ncbi:MAG: FAD:protein FMN transferase [Bacteroidales bacterium]|nr:FAD:protein FMN transferase [Bacteroidales bacterium]
MYKKFLLLLVVIITTNYSCNYVEKPQKIMFGGEIQGTYYAITYFEKDSINYQGEIDSLLKDFDNTASLWVENSIISRVNRNESDVVLNDHFIELFELSKKVSENTDGAFDITVGPLISAWGFGFSDRIKVDKYIVDSLLPLINFKAVSLSEGKIIKDNPGIKFDFNAIAQGYSVDLVAGFLRSKGINNYIVDIGGEVVANGNKPDGSLWKVGIEKPTETKDSERTLKAIVTLENKSLATSGSYRKYYEEDGVRYSHTINPKTGYPVTHSLLSVSVLAENATIADVYATAFMVMGLEESIKFLEGNQELEAYFIYSEKDILKTYCTKGLQKILKEEI